WAIPTGDRRETPERSARSSLPRPRGHGRPAIARRALCPRDPARPPLSPPPPRSSAERRPARDRRGHRGDCGCGMSGTIRLIGPGGAGKTTVGAALAERLAIPFLDLDAEFTARHG